MKGRYAQLIKAGETIMQIPAITPVCIYETSSLTRGKREVS